MKPVPTSQQILEKKFEKCTNIFIRIILICIICLIILALCGLTFNLVCIFHNYNKFRSIIQAQGNNTINNIKNINNISICFNDSNPLSYKFLHQQLDEIFEKKPYCYSENIKYLNTFFLECCDYNSFNVSISFKVNSSQIIKFQKYCSTKNNDDYGYRISRPCIIFLKQKNQSQTFYKIPIRIKVGHGDNRVIQCKLFNIINNETLLEQYNLRIKNGQC